MSSSHGRDQLADALLGKMEKEVLLTLLTDYDSSKSISEQDAEVILGAVQRASRRNVAGEYAEAKQKVRYAIVEWLEVLGA